MLEISNLTVSMSMFATGVLSRCYYWGFALLLDPFDFYRRIRLPGWPSWEFSPMTIICVFIALVGWTALLTYHELRMRVAPYSANEEDLRDEFLEFLRRSMLPAFVSAHNLAVFFAMRGKWSISESAEQRDYASCTIVRCSPSMIPLLTVVEKQYASVFSLVELERIFTAAYLNYNFAARNLQEACSRFEPNGADETRNFEIKRNAYFDWNKKLRTEITQLAKAGKFKIIKPGDGIDGLFSGPQYSQYHLIARHQQQAATYKAADNLRS